MRTLVGVLIFVALVVVVVEGTILAVFLSSDKVSKGSARYSESIGAAAINHLYWILNNSGSKLFDTCTNIPHSIDTVTIVTSTRGKLAPSIQEAVKKVRACGIQNVYVWLYVTSKTQNDAESELGELENASPIKVTGYMLDKELHNIDVRLTGLTSALIGNGQNIGNTISGIDMYFGEGYEPEYIGVCPKYCINQNSSPQCNIDSPDVAKAFVKTYKKHIQGNQGKGVLCVGNQGADCRTQYSKFPSLVEKINTQNAGIQSIGFYG